jgi:hypothetical protein
MSAQYPLAVLNTASITSLVRMTSYHHAISVYHTKAETKDGVAVLDGNVHNAAAENPRQPTHERHSRRVEYEEPNGHGGGRGQIIPRFARPATMAAEGCFAAVKGGGNVRRLALHYTVPPRDLTTMKSRA